MEGRQLHVIMQVTLLSALVALSHWGLLGLSSAQDGTQACGTELEMLAKNFAEEESDDLLEDCVTWLRDMRTSMKEGQANCPVAVSAICSKFDCQRRNNGTRKPDRSWQNSAHVTVRNILRVLDTQPNWHNCVIVYDFTSWRTLHLLTSSLAERHMDFIIYDVFKLNDTVSLRTILEDVFTVFNLRNVILLSVDVSFCAILFREAEAYDRKLGRTSGLRMFTRWIVTTSGGLEDELARTAAYFDNVVAIVENQETILTNYTSGLLDNRVECIVSDINTLMYTDSNGSREFQSSTVLLPRGDIIVGDAFPNIRLGFNTRTLIVGTKAWRPFVIKQENDLGQAEYTGMCMDLLRELARVLNFTYVLVEPPSPEGWGELNASGHWGGLVGQLQREEVDLVVAPISFTTDRALVMDATYPFTTNNLAVVFKKPDPDLEKWKTYLRPFKGEVLLSLGVTLLLVTCLLHVLAWLHPDSQRASAQGEEEKGKKTAQFPGPSPDDGFWYLYGALFSQGGILLPKAGSSRMLVSAWWLFSIVMGATYSGNLIAYLTVQLETRPFTTMEEMLDHNDYTWGVANKTSTAKLIMDSKNDVLKEIGRRLRAFAASDPDVFNMDLQVQMDRVQAGGYVHFTESVTTEAWTREYCDLDQVIDYHSISIPYSVSLPKGSAYTRLFNEYVMRIVEAGLMTKWKANWFADSLRCTKSTISSSPKISVLDVQSALFLCVIGLGLALIGLSLEFFCHRHPKLCFWTRNVGDACVNGCEEEKHTDTAAVHSNKGPNRKGGEFDGVFVVEEDDSGESKLPRVYDFSSLELRNRFLFDTVYSRPEDFGRMSSDDLYLSPGWERRGSRMVCITDDIKITT